MGICRARSVDCLCATLLRNRFAATGDSVLVSKVMPDTSRFGDKAQITVDHWVLRNVT